MRVWDPRTGSKTMKLRGHTDNIRALLLDSTGRLVEGASIKRICRVLHGYQLSLLMTNIYVDKHKIHYSYLIVILRFMWILSLS